MARLRTHQRCKVCGGSFKQQGDELLCPRHLTAPTKYQVDIHYNGERFRISGYNSAVDAIRAARDIESEIEQHRFKPENYASSRRVKKRFQFEYLYELWMEEQEHRMKREEISPSYYANLVSYGKKYISFFGTNDTRAIKTVDVKSFKRHVGSQEGISDTYLKKIINGLAKFFRDMYQDEVISELPLFPRIEVQETEGHWITREMQAAGLEHAGDLYRPALQFMFATGLRQAEVRAIKWDCVHFDADIPHIEIRRGFSVDTLREKTKEKNIGFVPITQQIAGILRTSQRRLDTDFVFYNVKGGKAMPFGRNALRYAWKRACEKAGIDYVPCTRGWPALIHHAEGPRWLRSREDRKGSDAQIFEVNEALHAH